MSGRGVSIEQRMAGMRPSAELLAFYRAKIDHADAELADLTAKLDRVVTAGLDQVLRLYRA